MRALARDVVHDSNAELDALLGELCNLMQERSIRRGKFTLASGAESDFYCNTKFTVLSPRGAWLIGHGLDLLLADSEAEAVGGLAMGAAYIAPLVALASSTRPNPIYAYTVRQEKKEHGLKQSIDESFHPDGNQLLCEGRRVAVVDDVVTKGGSILKAIEAVRAKGCIITDVIALVDRNEGGGDVLRGMNLPYRAVLEADKTGTLHVCNHSRSIGLAAAR